MAVAIDQERTDDRGCGGNDDRRRRRIRLNRAGDRSGGHR
jgi:hypothetical protein